MSRVQIIDPEEKRLEVIVEDTQLSLAIGKKGQNVRLASKLIGWNIDIKSEEEKRCEIEQQMAALTTPVTPLEELAGVGPKTIERLQAHGITAIERLADMTPEQLMEIPGIGEKMVEKIRAAVATYFERLESGAAFPETAGEENPETDSDSGDKASPEPAEAADSGAEPDEQTEAAAESDASAASEPVAPPAPSEGETRSDSEPGQISGSYEEEKV